MNIDISEKYFLNKKKNIQDYVVCMTKIIPYDNKTMWSNKDEFKQLRENIADLLINNLYFSEHQVNDDEDKFTLSEITNLINNEHQEYLGLIFYLALNLDYYNCSLNKSINFKTYLLGKLNSIKKYKINYRGIDNLIDKLKTDYKNDIKFFDEFKESNLINNYYCLSSKNNYFLVTYDFKIAELNQYKKLDVDFVTCGKEYSSKLFQLSLVNLNLLILKEILTKGKSNTFFIPYPLKYFDKKTNIEKFAKTFNSNYLKSKVKLLIDSDIINNYLAEINNLKAKGINTMMSGKIDYEKLDLYKDINLLKRKEDI